MKPSLAAKLAKLKETPIVSPAILAALQGRGELPTDVSALTRALDAEAAAVGALRERLADVAPIASGGSVLL